MREASTIRAYTLTYLGSYSFSQCYDVIGGTAGCIVAARLAEAGANSNVSVLIVEGGPNNYDEPSVIHPLLVVEHYRPVNKMTTFHMSNQEEQLGNRQLFEPVGGVLGGGSSINMSMPTIYHDTTCAFLLL